MTEILPNPAMPKMDKYPRKRPFLLIDIIQRPEDGVRTGKKGWNKVTGNLSGYEKATFVDRVNPKHLVSSAVIIDLLVGKCIKNPTGKPDQEVIEFYVTKYRTEATRAMDVWLSKAAQTAVSALKSSASDGTYEINPN